MIECDLCGSLLEDDDLVPGPETQPLTCKRCEAEMADPEAYSTRHSGLGPIPDWID